MTDRLGPHAVKGTLEDGALLLHDDTLGREVAARVLAPGADEGAFLREARLTGQLDHPGVVPVHALERADDGRPFFTMKRVQGDALPALAGEGRVSLARRLETFLKVCDAVAFAHARGVVHGDLGPARVVVGRFGEALVLGWGAAAAGDDPRADLPGLGHVLRALLGAGAPWELEAVARRAAEGGYPDAQALRDDVARFLEGRLVGAARYGPLRRAAKWTRRHRGAVALGATSLAAALLVAGAGARALHEARAFEAEAAAARAAAAAGRHEDALLASARALSRREDPALRVLAAGSAAALDRQAGARRRARDEAERLARLQEALRPLARKIDETRPYFHVAHVDIRRKLDEVEALLEPLERLANEPGLEGRAEPWALLGIGWALVGRPHRARAALERAHALSPDDPWVRYHLARLELEGAFIGAMRARRRSLGEEAAQDRLVRAARLLDHPALARTGELEQAFAAAVRAFGRGRPDEALRLANDAAARFAGELGVADLWLIIAATGADDPQGMLRAAERALELQPHAPLARLARAGLTFSITGRAAPALADLDAALRVHPLSPVLLHNRGAIRLASGDREGAVADLTLALREEPDAASYQNRGLALRLLGRLDEAVADLRRAVELSPAFVDGWVALGDALIATGRPEEAGAAFARGVELAPTDWFAVKGLTDLAVARRAYDEALAVVDRALAVRDLPSLRVLRMVVLSARRDPADGDGILREMRAATRLDPGESTREWVSRSLAHEILNERDRALADVSRALELQPTSSDTRLRRARLRVSLGELEGALADYDALELVRPVPAVLEERAGVRLQLGDLAGARADAERAVAGDPSQWRSWYFLGEARLRQGDGAGAEEAFAAARRHVPEDTRAGLERSIESARGGR